MLFRSKEEANGWCQAHDRLEGEVLTVGQVWELSRLWYRDRMAEHFAGRTVEEAHQIFAQLGLTTPFWRFG
ncbi:MAG: hypothetical protein V9G20_20675 [Candidatus Promineifilaceae bacterium]